MSNNLEFSPATTFVLGEYLPYDSQLPIAEIAGTRIVKCLYRRDPKVAASTAKVSVYVRIPSKHINEEAILNNFPALLPHIISYLESMEDELIKKEHASGLLRFYHEKLSFDAIIEQLESSNEGARLTKEKIEDWFVDIIESNLMSAFLAKLGLDPDSLDEAQLLKLELVLKAYKGKFSSLAGGKTYLKPADCAALLKVLADCDSTKSNIGARLSSRLSAMESKEQEDLLCL